MRIKLRRVISMFLVVAFVITMCFVVNPVNNVFAAGQNIALNKVGTVSSVEGAGFEAGKAFDGSATTRWASIEGSNTQWIKVDLGASYNIARVKLLWEAAYGKSYRIEVSSDNTNWTSVYSTTTGNGETDDISFSSVNARYVRMYGTQRGTSYGYSLYEFEVYEGTSSQIPAVPTGLTASATSSSQINVSWSTSSGATGYDLEVDGTVVTGIASPYAHTGLTANSSHSYRVRATNAAGTSAWSTSANATTSTAPQVPAVPTGLVASAVSSSQINVSWGTSSGATGYDLEVDGTVNSDKTSPYAHIGLSASSTHSYRVRAKNSVGTSAWSVVSSATTSNAVADVALNKAGTTSSIEGAGFEAAKAFDGNATTRWASIEAVDPQWIYVDLVNSYNVVGVKLTWESAYAKSYRIEVSSDKTNWTSVYSTTTGNGATDDISFNGTNGRYVRMYGTQRGTTYGYSLFGFEVYGGEATPQIPAVPTGLVASAVSTSQVNVSWGNSSGATGYDLEVDGTVNSDKTSPYAHTGLSASSTHSYRVRAKNSAGTSAWSAAASATTLPIAGGVARPFPQNLSYAGCIKPNQETQAQLNNDVISAYTYWKTNYLKTAPVTPGGYYVYTTGITGDGVVDPITCSEAHGYGMMTTALMAGYDSNAKTYFDGLYKMYNAHRSSGNNNLMAWAISRSENQADGGGDSATDGDMDIAYGLLLAHYQWGSNGTINYLAEAKRIINNGLKGSDVSTSTYRTLLGDWSTDQYATRGSDWMTDHFRVYAAATGDSFWNNVTNTTYGLISRMHLNYSQNTGLVPDFVIGNPAQPAPPNYLEFEEDGDYGYNACRYPWRIATDYALFGSSDAKTAMNKLINWLKTKTSNNPSNITACYDLSTGTALHPGETSLAFTSPFIAACIVDSAHQNYLNQGWNLIKSSREGYYGDSINLLCMILISGNWWAPQ